VVGIPTEATLTAEYFGFQESAADVVALVSVLHFHAFMDHLLTCCHGNLYALNELNRIGELSETEQIRLASNGLRMSDVIDVSTPAQHLSQRQRHRLGEPLTGALFDIFVDLFERKLVQRGLVTPALDALSRTTVDNLERDADQIQTLFDKAYQGNHAAFKEALIEARDYLGVSLAHMWRRLSPDYLTFRDVGLALLEVDHGLTGGQYRQIIADCFEWREINLLGASKKRFEHLQLASVMRQPHQPFSLSYLQRRVIMAKGGLLVD
jgi:hypothetical protein